jgi:hypothetical protein
MTDNLSDRRQGVTPAVHDVLDALENLREGPFNRVPVDAIVHEIDLVGGTMMRAALDGEGKRFCPAAASVALGLPDAVRMAALLLLGIERAAAQTAAISAGAL